MIRVVAVLAAAVLAGSAIAHAAEGGRAGAGPALVTVGDGPGARATGFSAGRERVVTVAHVLSGAAVTVRGADGVARRGRVLRRDDAADLALVAVPGLPGGTGVEAIGGEPGALAVVHVRDGPRPVTVVRRADARVRAGDGRLLARRPVLELRADVRSGDSGAPVVDAGGRVVGVVFARSRGRDGVAWAVDARAVARLVG